MILVAGLAVVVLSVVVFGGDLTRILELRIRWAQLPLGALAVQVLVINVLPAELPTVAAEGLHLATYVAAAVFVYANRHIAGLWLVAIGGGANLAAISANGGRMPASANALRIAGLHLASGFTNSGFVAHARLPWLGDIFAVPRAWPLANVFSVGDILLVAGAFAVLHESCLSRLSASRRAGPISMAVA